MTTMVLYAVLCASASYLLTRAKITEWLWSRYPAPVAQFLDCTACSGFWFGVGCGIWGALAARPFADLPAHAWYTVLITGLFGMIATPIVSFAHTYAWSALTFEEE